MKALVLLSGGMDSCVALWWAKSRGWKVEALTIDFHRRGKREAAAARGVARRAGVKLHTVRMEFVRDEEDLSSAELRNLGSRVREGYIPARNLAFYGIAAHLGLRRGARRLVGGHTAEDGRDFGDASRAFFKHLSSALASSSPRKRPALRPVMPLITMTKPQVARLGARLGAPLGLTWSCYRDRRLPCDECPACRGRREAFKSAGLSN